MPIDWLDASQKRLIKETIALLPSGPKPLVFAFCGRLFELALKTRSIFRDNLEKQAQKLTEMLVWIVENLDKPDDLLGAPATAFQSTTARTWDRP